MEWKMSVSTRCLFQNYIIKNVHVLKKMCMRCKRCKIRSIPIIHPIRLIIYSDISESRIIEERIYIEQLKYPHVYEHIESSLILHRSGIIKRAITA